VNFVEKKEETSQSIVLGRNQNKELIEKWWRPVYGIHT
jgi:hypothetical protein